VNHRTRSVAFAGCFLATATARAQTPAAPPPNVTVDGRPGSGVTVTLRNPSVSLALSSRVQVRATLTVPPEGDAQTDISVRTLRVILSGHAFSPDVRYYLQLALASQDYEQGSSSPLFDVWVAWTRLRDLQLRVGQFFVPFDRARTIREATLQFVDRQLVVGELNLDRDVGVELSSRDLFGLGGRLHYNLGVFSGEGRNRAGGEAGFLYVARVQVNPLGAFDDCNIEGDLERRRTPRLALGVAGAYNQATVRQRSTLGATFTHGAYDYLHAAADLHFKWYGVSLLAEWLYRYSSVAHHDYTANGNTQSEWSRSGWGYLVQAGVMLGAHVELVGRWGQLRTTGETDPELVRAVAAQGNEVAAGVNWYVAGHPYKLQADWQATFGDDFGRARHLARLQVQLTL
jgi:hypothetical protein